MTAFDGETNHHRSLCLQTSRIKHMYKKGHEMPSKSIKENLYSVRIACPKCGMRIGMCCVPGSNCYERYRASLSIPVARATSIMKSYRNPAHKTWSKDCVESDHFKCSGFRNKKRNHGMLPPLCLCKCHRKRAASPDATITK